MPSEFLCALQQLAEQLGYVATASDTGLVLTRQAVRVVVTSDRIEISGATTEY